MGSFRKRLLVLIIGLSVVTQTVTLAAVLIGTRPTVEARAAEQLRSAGSLAEQLIGFRAGQLANGVAALAADLGLREAGASGDAPPTPSTARNHSRRGRAASEPPRRAPRARSRRRASCRTSRACGIRTA